MTLHRIFKVQSGHIDDDDMEIQNERDDQARLAMTVAEASLLQEHFESCPAGP